MKLKLSIATDAVIRAESSGEVTNMGMYNLKFHDPKPFTGGLFCQRIFGPLVTGKCECGNQLVMGAPPCNVCGMVAMHRESRRRRMGHIETIVPYVNPLAIKRMAALFGFPEREFGQFLIGRYRFVVQEAGLAAKMVGDDRERVREANATLPEYEDREKYAMFYSNTIPVQDSTKRLAVVMIKIRRMSEHESSELGLLSLIQALVANHADMKAYIEECEDPTVINSGYTEFSDFYNTTVLVNPPSYRDVGISNGVMSYHPTNLLYLRILRHAIRIRSIRDTAEASEALLSLIPRESIVMQKMVNGLILEGTKDYRGNLIKPMINNLKGKGGRIRGNLLGKRVDYSGRSVVTSAPHLPLDTLGVPFKMMYELLQPDILGELENLYGGPTNEGYNMYDISNKVQRMYKNKSRVALEVCWRLCENATVFMNRAPSLHRYSVWGFKVRPHMGKEIQVPPMAMGGQNMDVDGDTAAIHRVLTDRACWEVRSLMMVNQNINSSIDFDSPVVKPSHEMVVGLFQATTVDM